MEVLQKKFDEFQKDMANNEDRVAEVNQTADTLIMEQHPDGDAIQKKREVMDWNHRRHWLVNCNHKLLIGNYYSRNY